MKKIMLLIVVGAVHLSLSAQSPSQVVERFRSFEMTFTSTHAAKSDEQAVRLLITTLETGWNNKSGATYSSVFADVHDYIVVNGMYFSNFTKKGNEAAHQGLFDGVYKNTNIQLKVDKITFLRPDLAQLIAIGASYEKGTALPENPEIIMTVLAENKNNTWKIISFHNHQLNIEEIKQRGVPMNAMYASWYRK